MDPKRAALKRMRTKATSIAADRAKQTTSFSYAVTTHRRIAMTHVREWRSHKKLESFEKWPDDGKTVVSRSVSRRASREVFTEIFAADRRTAAPPDGRMAMVAV